MKPFDIELAKAGHPVQTSDGRPVRIICYDRKSKDNIYPIIAVIENEDTYEEAQYFTQKGEERQGEENDLDLFMAPIKKEGWINIYRGRVKRECGDFYESEEEAKSNIRPGSNDYITTIKIEWEE